MGLGWILFVLACADDVRIASVDEPSGTSEAEFIAVMEELATAWNEGDARRAADCFAVDAVYSDPPDKQLYRGRDALYEFFGGDEGRAGQMSMEWHHLAFNAEDQIGFGEFTFSYGSAAHGIVVVRMRDGKIGNWREYWYESDLSWEEFVSRNPF